MSQDLLYRVEAAINQTRDPAGLRACRHFDRTLALNNALDYHPAWHKGRNSKIQRHGTDSLSKETLGHQQNSSNVSQTPYSMQIHKEGWAENA